MSNKNKNTSEACCDTDQTKYTQVKTLYARAAVLLLEINFCLTGYVLNSVIQIQSEQQSSTSGTAATATTTLGAPMKTQDTTSRTDTREYEQELKPDGSNARE